MLYDNTQIEKINEIIDESYYWDIRLFDIDYSDISNMRMLLPWGKDETSTLEVILINCKHVSYETESNWRPVIPIKRHSFLALSHDGQSLEIKKSEEGIEAYFDIHIDFIYIECEKIWLKVRRLDEFEFFWQDNTEDMIDNVFSILQPSYKERAFKNGFAYFEDWLQDIKDVKLKLIDITNEYMGDEIRVRFVDEAENTREVYCLLCYKVDYRISENEEGRVYSREEIIRDNSFRENQVELLGVETVEGSTYPRNFVDMLKLRFKLDKMTMEVMCREVRVR